MPLYEYQCESCNHRFERIQKYADPPIDTCPKCGGKTKKLFSSPAIQFKGTGWYITDYARKGSSDGGGKGGSSKSDSQASDAASEKAEKAEKAGTSEKSDKSEKSEKSDKADKTTKADSGSSSSSSSDSSSTKSEAKAESK